MSEFAMSRPCGEDITRERGNSNPARAFGPRARAAALTVALAAVLAACGSKDGGDKPTGQVVARMNNEDITLIDINTELEGTAVPPNMTRREAEKAALANIVTRRMLADAATERELTKTPQYVMQQRRLEEQLKVQSLARAIASGVAKPSRDEALAFMDANPYLFAQRRIFEVDQIQFPRPAEIDELGLEAAKTMAAVEAALNSQGIAFRRSPAALDALAANPEFVKEISTLLSDKPEELFMFSTRAPNVPVPVMLVNQVRNIRTEPFVGDKAIEFATRYLQNQRVQKALASEVEKQRAAAADKVAYQEGWEPSDTDGADAALPKAAGEPGLLPVPDEHALPASAGAAANPAAAAE